MTISVVWEWLRHKLAGPRKGELVTCGHCRQWLIVGAKGTESYWPEYACSADCWDVMYERNTI